MIYDLGSASGIRCCFWVWTWGWNLGCRGWDEYRICGLWFMEHDVLSCIVNDMIDRSWFSFEGIDRVS